MKIVLVHGIWDRGRVFRHMIAGLEQAGHSCFAPDLKPADGRDGLHDLAEKLVAYVAESLSATDEFVLIGFSMGAIVSRIYLQRLGGDKRVARFYSISGPHQGTLTASIWPGRAARDMRRRSELLKELNADTSVLQKLGSRSFRTPFDLMILPPKSSKVGWATNHLVYCPLHPLMPRQLAIEKQIIEDLES